MIHNKLQLNDDRTYARYAQNVLQPSYSPSFYANQST